MDNPNSKITSNAEIGEDKGKGKDKTNSFSSRIENYNGKISPLIKDNLRMPLMSQLQKFGENLDTAWFGGACFQIEQILDFAESNLDVDFFRKFSFLSF